VVTGTGEAQGFEVEIRRRIGKINGWINYTYSESTRLFEDLNNGLPFPASFNRLHNLKMSWLYQVSNNAEFTFNWTYGTGLYYSDLDGLLPVNDDRATVILIYDRLNAAQLEDYHRLDISINFYNKYEWGQQKMSLGVYNAYNRNNPLFFEVRRSLTDPTKFEKFSTSLLPILPSFSYNLAF